MAKASAQNSAPNGDDTVSAEVAVVTPNQVLSDETLKNISSFKDLDALLRQDGGTIVDISEFGTGYVIATEQAKRSLVGVDMAIIGWKFSDGNYGEFVSLFTIVSDGRKLIINDGSTGIYRQMKNVAAAVPSDKMTVVRCRSGLTASDYTYVDEKGEERPAHTFYLNLA